MCVKMERREIKSVNVNVKRLELLLNQFILMTLNITNVRVVISNLRVSWQL